MDVRQFTDGAEHRRYIVRGKRGQWLATVFLCADGLMTTVSDYGNYGYWWRSIGGDGDIRAFLCRVSDDYLVGKIAPQWETDPDASEAAIKQTIVRLRRAGTITADEARDEWELLSHVRDGDTGGWWANTSLGKHAFPGDLWCERRSPQAMAFAEHVMPRLREMLQAEMTAEKGAAK